MRKKTIIIIVIFFILISFLSILFCKVMDMSILYSIGMMSVVAIILPVFMYFVNYLYMKDKPKNNAFKNIEIPGFDSLYEMLIEEYESDMKKMRNTYIFTRISRIIVFPMFVFSIGLSEMKTVFISKELTIGIVASTIPLGILYALALLINIDKKEKYRKLYKETVIPKLINLIDPFLVYKTTEIDMYSTKREYENAELDNEKYLKLSVDDYIEGSINENKFIEISEVDVWNEDNYHRRFATLFKGIFAYATTDTFVDGTIKIHRPDTPVNKKFKKINMANKEFGKNFEVYTTNELITKIVLYDELMEKLVELKKKFNITYEVVLKENDIYIRIYSGPMFEPNLIGKPIDRNVLLKYYSLVKFTIDLANELNARLPKKEIEEI